MISLGLKVKECDRNVFFLFSADMTCRQLHQLYFEMKERVFKNPWLGLVCNTKELETILKEKFGEETMMTSQPKKPKLGDNYTGNLGS